MTAVVSYFSACFVMHWPQYMLGDDGDPIKLRYPPQFDGRLVCYPSLQNIRDYLSWRQADCHVNNLYNTTFWALVLKGGLSEEAATQRLSVQGKSSWLCVMVRW
eukprot:m.232003 g.232003  ORF g.232003 m.232003 type:complete len:104 (+) comp18879_c0_seq3:294-605(+)